VFRSHCERAGGAGFDAQSAENAPQVVDLVHASVPFTGRVLRVSGVVPALDVNRVCRAGPRAQLATNALLKPVRVTVELVPALIARHGGRLLVRVLLGHSGTEKVAHSDAKARNWRQCASYGSVLGKVGLKGDVSTVAFPVHFPDVVMFTHLRASFQFSRARAGVNSAARTRRRGQTLVRQWRHGVTAREGVEFFWLRL